MKPGWWIGILALAVIGYALSKFTGWYGASSGAVIGALIGTLVYARLKDRAKPD